ncbi:MAG: hypothetical protein ABSF26_01765 [Thermoguttaceae bacterium]|jgi:hypothetical protein
MALKSISAAFLSLFGVCTLALAADRYDVPNSCRDPWNIERGMMFDALQMQQRFPYLPNSPTITGPVSFVGPTAIGDIQPAGDPAMFDSAADVIQWANRTSADSARITELSYKGRKLLVVFRSHTLGRYSSEPFVFAEQSGKWVRLLHAATCFFHTEASIDGNWLVLWRLKEPGDKAKTEFLKYNLLELDAALAPPRSTGGRAAAPPPR